jgi:hypothetical protein
MYYYPTVSSEFLEGIVVHKLMKRLFSLLKDSLEAVVLSQQTITFLLF